RSSCGSYGLRRAGCDFRSGEYLAGGCPGRRGASGSLRPGRNSASSSGAFGQSRPGQRDGPARRSAGRRENDLEKGRRANGQGISGDAGECRSSDASFLARTFAGNRRVNARCVTGMGQRCEIGKAMKGQSLQVPHQQEMNRLGEREKQIRFYGESVDPEEEISRPRCYPRPVQYLLDFKIRTAWQMLNGDTTAACKGEEKTLVVCCGSGMELEIDRKSTRLNSSHGSISYAVFCLKKKQYALEATGGRAQKGLPVQDRDVVVNLEVLPEARTGRHRPKLPRRDLTVWSGP